MSSTMRDEEKSPRRRRLGRRGRRVVAALAALALLGLAVRAALPWALAFGLRRAAEGELGWALAIEEVDLGLVRGRVELAGVDARRRDAPDATRDAGPSLLRAERLALDLSWPSLASGRLVLSEVALEGPALRLEQRSDGSLAPLLGERPAPEAPSTPEAAEEPASERAPSGAPSEAGEGESAGAPEADAEAEAGWPLLVERLAVEEAKLRLDGPGRSEPLVEVALGGLEVRSVGLEAGVVTLGSVALQSPRVRVSEAWLRPARGEGAGGAAERPREPGAGEAEAEEPPPEDAAPAVAHRLRRIGVEDARFVLLAEERPIEARLGLRASEVSMAEGERFPVEARLEVADGALELDGRAALAPPGLDGELTLDALALPVLARALAPERAAALRGGRASGELALRARAGPPPQGGAAPRLQLSGRLELAGLDWAEPTEEGEEGNALGWERLELALRELRVPAGGGPVRLDAERLGVEGPRLRLVRPPAEGAPGSESEPEAEEAEPEGEDGPPIVRATLGALEVEGAEATLVDRSVEPPLRSALRSFALSGRGLAWPGPRAEHLEASGRVRDARLALESSLGERTGRLQLELDRLGLAPLDPYLLEVAGFGVESGSASLEGEVALEGEQVDGESRLEVDQLAVGPTAEGTFASRFGVPLNLALALLRGPGGTVSLRIGLSGSRGELSSDMGRIVASALRQALVGAMSTPLKALGAVLPSGDAEAIRVEPFPFPAGAARPLPPARQRIDELAGLLASRPGLAVSLTGRAGPSDRPALARAWLAERALADEPLPETPGLASDERERLASALAARARGERELAPAERALLERAGAAVALPAARLDALARDRAEHVRKRLLARPEVDAERAVLAPPASPGDPAVLAELRPSG